MILGPNPSLALILSRHHLASSRPRLAARIDHAEPVHPCAQRISTALVQYRETLTEIVARTGRGAVSFSDRIRRWR